MTRKVEVYALDKHKKQGDWTGWEVLELGRTDVVMEVGWVDGWVRGGATS